MHTEARKYSYSFVPNCRDWLKKRTYQRKNYHFFLKWEGELEINLRIKQKKSKHEHNNKHVKKQQGNNHPSSTLIMNKFTAKSIFLKF